MSQSGLTNLKKIVPANSRDNPPVDRPRTKDGFTSMAKMKPIVLRGRDLDIEKTNADIKDLHRQKEVLLEDVKKLGSVFFGLKRAKEESEKRFDDYATNRIVSLEYIAREVSDELKTRAEELSKRAKLIDGTKRELDAVKIDLVKREEALGTTSEALSKRESDLAKEKSGLSTQKQEISKMQGKLGGKISTLARKEREIDALYNKIHDISRYFENKADAEIHRLDSWAKTLEIREKKVEATKRGFKKRERELDDRTLWLLDREDMSRRTMLEVQKAKRDIIKK